MDKLNDYNGVADCGYRMISHAGETCTQCDKPPSYIYSITTLRAPFQRSIFHGSPRHRAGGPLSCPGRSRMLKVPSVLALASGLSLAALLSVRAADAGSYDGTWTVELVTESGFCDGSHSYSVAVRAGQVRLLSASDETTRMSGRVGPDGTVGLNVSQGSASGSVLGRLQARSGSGTWKVSAICSGRWAASRRSTVTAQAL